MRQIAANIAPSLTQEIVLGRPKLMAELTQLFKARFDPDIREIAKAVQNVKTVLKDTFVASSHTMKTSSSQPYVTSCAIP